MDFDFPFMLRNWNSSGKEFININSRRILKNLYSYKMCECLSNLRFALAFWFLKNGGGWGMNKRKYFSLRVCLASMISQIGSNSYCNSKYWKKKSSLDELQNHRQYAVTSKVNILPNRFLIQGTRCARNRMWYISSTTF